MKHHMITTLESQQSSAAEFINFSDQVGAALNPNSIVIQSEFTFCFSFRLHFVNIRGIFHTPDAAPWGHAPAIASDEKNAAGKHLEKHLTLSNKATM